jgi:hypothetical protein
MLLFADKPGDCYSVVIYRFVLTRGGVTGGFFILAQHHSWNDRPGLGSVGMRNDGRRAAGGQLTLSEPSCQIGAG